MNKKNIRESAALGTIIGGALGVLLDGVMLSVPGGKTVIVIKKLAQVKTATKTIKVSATAVGTLLGAASGIAENKKNEKRR